VLSASYDFCPCFPLRLPRTPEWHVGSLQQLQLTRSHTEPHRSPSLRTMSGAAAHPERARHSTDRGDAANPDSRKRTQPTIRMLRFAERELSRGSALRSPIKGPSPTFARAAMKRCGDEIAHEGAARIWKHDYTPPSHILSRRSFESSPHAVPKLAITRSVVTYT
jgi:hypothetical protein